MPVGGAYVCVYLSHFDFHCAVLAREVQHFGRGESHAAIVHCGKQGDGLVMFEHMKPRVSKWASEADSA